MNTKKRILLKITGESFLGPDRTLCPKTILSLIEQIKQLMTTHTFGIVVGGGNFFRGNNEGKRLGMTASSGHQVGILATMLNGIILKDLFAQHDIPTTIYCAIECPTAGEPISQQSIFAALQKEHTIIFTGGTGNPFFTTDTNAVLRGLQMDAAQIWKGTKVDGVYDRDPHKDSNAQLLKNVTYMQAINQNLQIIDPPALALAQQHKQTIRVFNIFQTDALIKAASDDSFGSRISY